MATGTVLGVVFGGMRSLFQDRKCKGKKGEDFEMGQGLFHRFCRFDKFNPVCNPEGTFAYPAGFKTCRVAYKELSIIPDLLAQFDQHAIRAFGMQETNQLIIGALFRFFIE